MNENIENLKKMQITQETAPKTMLFVSDLPENISDNELQIFFNNYKDSIYLLQLNSNPRQNENKASSNATVIFKDSKKADEARNALNLKKLKGKTVRIMWHERDNSLRYNNEFNIFIKNIPQNVKPREIYEKFLYFGEIVSAKVPEDENGNHNGYGYIHYVDNEAAQKALEYCEKNKIFDETLDVKYFQKKAERITQLTGNKNVFVKNIPSNTTEDEIKSLFNKYGDVTWMKLNEENEKKFATISFESEDSSAKAINELNGLNFKGNELFVNNLIKKSDREKTLNYKPTDNFSRFNKNCNLHIRNIPYDCTEEYLTEVFSKYGEIISSKIQKYTLVTKQGEEIKNQTMSKGFGYVCFASDEAASAAKEDYNEKRLPKYETWNRPLLIEFFMPKGERQGINKQINSQFNPFQMNKKIPFMGSMPSVNYMMPMYQPSVGNLGGPMVKMGGNTNMGSNMGGMSMPPNMGNMPMYSRPNPNFKKVMQYPPNMNNPTGQNKQPTNQNKQPILVQTTTPNVLIEEPDVKYMERLEDDGARKEYLGELIFKKIENYLVSRHKDITIDTIGKITGMILGIEEINEIVEITKNNDQLHLRIQEALELLDESK